MICMYAGETDETEKAGIMAFPAQFFIRAEALGRLKKRGFKIHCKNNAQTGRLKKMRGAVLDGFSDGLYSPRLLVGA